MGASFDANREKELAPMGRSYLRMIHKGWALLGGGGIMAR